MAVSHTVIFVCILANLLLVQPLTITYYVRPDGNTPCPTASNCFTLSEYAENDTLVLGLDSAFLFLPGTHTLSGDFIAANISSLILSGPETTSPPQAQILCTPPAGFTFENISRVEISSLAFTSCGRPGSLFSIPNAILVNSVEDFLLRSAVLQESVSSALFLYVSNATIENSGFNRNRGGAFGGASVIVDSTARFSNNSFTDNSATQGGAMHAERSTIDISGINTFERNTAGGAGGAAQSFGGAVYLLRSNVTFHGSTHFTSNTAPSIGGAMYTRESMIVLTENVTFKGNYGPTRGGGLRTDSTVLTAGSNSYCHFVNNSAQFRGGGAYFEEGTVKFLGITTFTNNTALRGGGVYCDEGTVESLGNTTFTGNTAQRGGGAYFEEGTVHFLGNTTFTGNTAQENKTGGGVSAVSTTLSFSGTSNFSGNSAGLGGGLYLQNGMLTLNGTSLFSNNSAGLGAGVEAYKSNVVLLGNTSFVDNDAFLTVGGGVYAESSNLSFVGHVCFLDNRANQGGGGIYGKATDISIRASGNSETTTFSLINNSANQGGGISLEQNSAIYLYPPLQLYFQNNSASKGGGIFVRDVFTLSECFAELGTLQMNEDRDDILSDDDCNSNPCFLQPESISPEDTKLVFINNSATVAGSVLYGGKLERCQFTTDVHYNGTPLEAFMNLSTIVSSDSFTSTISSDPTGICFHLNGETFCDSYSVSVSRGRRFILSAVAVGQAEGAVPTEIRSSFGSGSGEDASLGENQLIQPTGKNFTDLEYRVLSPDDFEELVLYPDGPCRDLGIANRSISVHLQPCPDGFQLSYSRCICEERLQTFTNSCNVDNGTILRSSNFWMSGLYVNGSYKGLILHPHCPFDYCLTTHLYFDPSDSNAQCASDRTGILCGSCQKNYSLVFGSSHCLQCTNAYISLLIPFALAGIVLVVLILILRLTVSVGTINGLIFYANVLAINRALFFPPEDTNILTVFIAWLNLDLGIETCFYDGMDAYARTWLQFVFPFYLWLFAAVIILASHFSQKLSRLLGTNPVSVLATIFLLSYAKLYRTIIAALSYTFLEYPDGSRVSVWLLDGNIRYLSAKHIPLFLTALAALLFLFLPYTLFLLLGQWMLALSNRKAFSWISKPTVKTFLDAYYGPYQDKHRYWTGLLLLLRGILFLIFAFNAVDDPSINLLCITTASLGLTIMTRFTGQIYKKLWLDALEASFILNLGILATATYHVSLTGGNQAALIYTSVSIAFVTFLGILFDHVYLQIRNTALWNSIPKPNFSIPSVYRRTLTSANDSYNQHLGQFETESKFPTSSDLGKVVTSTSTTYVELREPLLEDADC